MQTKSIDENEFEYEGKTYVLVPKVGCWGCAFRAAGFACDAPGVAPECFHPSRIFIEKTA
jgi:hypothetical protein